MDTTSTLIILVLAVAVVVLLLWLTYCQGRRRGFGEFEEMLRDTHECQCREQQCGKYVPRPDLNTSGENGTFPP